MLAITNQGSNASDRNIRLVPFSSGVMSQRNRRGYVLFSERAKLATAQCYQRTSAVFSKNACQTKNWVSMTIPYLQIIAKMTVILLTVNLTPGYYVADFACAEKSVRRIGFVRDKWFRSKRLYKAVDVFDENTCSS